MKLEWIGHSCFRLTTRDGVVAITDPYDAKTGYKMVPLRADLITMSHRHGDHCCQEQIVGKPQIARGIEGAQVGAIKTWAMRSFHDEVGGMERGENAVRVFEADGLKIVHMGDQGCMPAPEIIDAISDADALLIPCGGFFTVDAEGAKEIVDAAHPRLVVPMHMRLARGGYDVLSTVEPFLEVMGVPGLQPVDALEWTPGASAPGGVALLRPLAGKL